VSLLAFYRRDEPRVRGILVRGGVSLSVGALLLLLCALTERLHLATGVRVGMSVLGALLFGHALVTGFMQLPTLLRHDVYVAIRTDGLLLNLEPDPEILLPWADLASIDAVGEEVVLRRRAGDPIRLRGRYGGKSQADLARCLDDARRKSSLDLLGQ
jgi:hypothetical protein